MSYPHYRKENRIHEVKQLSYEDLNLDFPVEKKLGFFSDTLLVINLNSLVFLF